MSKCHTCNKELSSSEEKKPWLADHKCPYCHATQGLVYCKSCYWWEVGPLPALAALPKELKAPEESEVQLVTPCPLEEEKKAEEAQTLKERREALLDDMKGKCALVKKQSEGEFETQLTTALEAYDNLYHPKKEVVELKEDIEYQRMMHTLIVIHMSALKRCSDPRDKYAHRHVAPPIAAKHLQICFYEAPKGGEPFLPTNKEKIAAAALGQETIERYLKGKLSVARANKEIREACKEAGVSDPLHLQEAARIAIMIFHCATVKRDADKTSEGADFKKFKPYAASGYLSDDYKKEWYDAGAPFAAFTKKTQQRLGTLYATLFMKGAEEEDARFKGDRDAINGLVNTVLTRQHADFLLSLPKMDHTGDAVGTDAPPCEVNVRTRLLARLQSLLSTDQFKEIMTLGAKILGATTTRDDKKKELRKCWFWQKAKKKQLKAELSLAGIELTQAEEKERRLAPWTLAFSEYVYEADNSLKDLAGLLDAIIDDMNSGRYWIEMTFKDGLLKGYTGVPEEVRPGFFLHCQTHDYVKDIEWAKIFDSCPGATGSFKGMVYDAEAELGSATDGRQEALEWYLDWRIEKDRLLYDYFEIPPAELSVFASYTLHLYHEYPFPFPLYGHHNIIWDANMIGPERSVLTLSDRGFPRRSKLLLLQDILCSDRDKFGFEPDLDDRKKRFNAFQRILLHLYRMPSPSEGVPSTDTPPYNRTKLLAKLESLAGEMELETEDFDKDNHCPYFDDGYFPVIECHIFGKALVHDNSLAFTLARRHVTPEHTTTVEEASEWVEPARKLLGDNNTKYYDYGMKASSLVKPDLSLGMAPIKAQTMYQHLGKPTAAEVDT